MADAPDLAALDDDDDVFDMRALTRMVAWGTGAAAALFLAVLAGMSGPGEHRAKTAIATLSGKIELPKAKPAPSPPPQVAAVPIEKEREARREETRKLSEQIRQLSADRERLTQRLGLVERNLADVTGSIKRYEERVSTAAPEAAPRPLAAEAHGGDPAIAALPTQGPATIAAWPAPPITTGAADALHSPWPNSAAVNWPDAAPHTASVSPRTPLPLPRPEQPTTPTAPTAQAAPEGHEPPTQVASRQAKPEPPLVRGGYGVDLGGAVSVDRLRMLWNAVRTNESRLLRGMRPVAHTRRSPRGGRPDVRLVVGPLPNAEAATKLCAALLNAGRYCEPARYEGHRLR